ncbi:MAG: hypothetical protein N2380_05165, partial [bacterium]|nr:hypothetical protein [bacterium]
VYHGLGIPRQASLISGVFAYSPEWEKAWAEYDPKKANAMLDEIGLSKRDKNLLLIRQERQMVTLYYLSIMEPYIYFTLQ